MPSGETVAARVSSRLKEALGLYADRLGITPSKLGRVAVKLFLRQPLISDINYELVEVSKRFPNNRKELMSVALSSEEAERLRELAAHYKRPLSEVLTLALAGVLSEPRDAVLEEVYGMGPPRARERAVQAGIIWPATGDPQPRGDKVRAVQTRSGNNRPEDSSGDPSPSPETVAVLAAVGAAAAVAPVIWAIASVMGVFGPADGPSG